MRRGQAGVEMMAAMAIILIVLVLIGLLLIDRSNQSERLNIFWNLQLECERLTNLTDSVHSDGFRTTVFTRTNDYNAFFSSTDRGLTLTNGENFAVCSFGASRVFDDSNNVIFTVPPLSNIKIENPGGQKVVVSVV